MPSLQPDHTQFSLSEWGLSVFGVEDDVSRGKSCEMSETFAIFLKVSEISGDSVGSAADQWEHTDSSSQSCRTSSSDAHWQPAEARRHVPFDIFTPAACRPVDPVIDLCLFSL